MLLQDPYTELAAAQQRQRQLPPPQTQSFQDRLAPQSAARQTALQPARAQRQQPAMQRQEAYAPAAAQSRDPRSRNYVDVPPSMPAANRVRPIVGLEGDPTCRKLTVFSSLHLC